MAHRDKDKGIANRPSANLYISAPGPSGCPQRRNKEEGVDSGSMQAFALVMMISFPIHGEGLVQ